MSTTPHPGSEHLIILPDREVAEGLAEDLREEGFEQVRVVREAARTEEDDEDHEWAVHVQDTRLPDTSGGGAYEGLIEELGGAPTYGCGNGSPRSPVSTAAGTTSRGTTGRRHPDLTADDRP